MRVKQIARFVQFLFQTMEGRIRVVPSAHDSVLLEGYDVSEWYCRLDPQVDSQSTVVLPDATAPCSRAQSGFH